MNNTQRASACPANTSAAHLPLENGPSIVELHRDDLDQLTQHFLSLNAENRYARFGYALCDDSIRHYAQKIDFQKTRIFGLTDGKKNLLTVAEFHRLESNQTELALSFTSPLLTQGQTQLLHKLITKTMAPTDHHHPLTPVLAPVNRIPRHEDWQEGNPYEYDGIAA